jgi:hypothetical protein
VVTLTPGSSGLDMSTVTAVTLVARASDGTETDWTTTLSAQTASGLIATHVFSSTDVPSETQLRVMPECTVPGGTRRCYPFTLIVVP